MLSLSISLAAFLGAAAPPTTSTAPVNAPQVPGATQKAVDVLKAIRVRATLELRMATDKNSTDEIYYFVVQPAVGDTLKITEKRPAGDPDI